ncbi:MAG: hypothetical protein IT458_19105 [Planctomycetes bacterium]|nr:hypothetical protein [Planctomycetota bacterium]
MSRKRIVLLFAGFLALLLATTYVVLDLSGASRKVVEQLLARFIRSDFLLGRANLDLGSGTVVLGELTLKHPRTKDPMMLLRDLSVSVDTNPLGAVGAVRRVTVRGGTLDIGLTADEMPDLREILKLPELEAGRQAADDYPAVSISDFHVRLRVAPGTVPIEFRDVRLDLQPEEPGSPRMRLVGTMTSNLGRKVAVSGRADFAANRFQALVEAEDVPIDAERLQHIDPAFVGPLRDAGIKGRAKRISAWVEYPDDSVPEGGRIPIGAGLSVEVEELDFVPPHFPYPIHGARLKAAASTRLGGLLRFELQQRSAQGGIQAFGELTQVLSGEPFLDVRLTLTDMEVGETLRGAFLSEAVARHIPNARRAFAAFDPRGGRADAEIRLWIDDPPEVPEFAMDLEVRGVSGTFLGFPPAAGETPIAFPYRVEDVHGTIQVRPDEVAIHDVTARRDGADLAINGRVRMYPKPSGDSTWIDVSGRDVVFSRELRDALDRLVAGAGAIYDEHSPEGRTDVTVNVRSDPGQSPADVLVRVRPQGCGVTWRGFPYRLDGVRGLVEIDNQGVNLDLLGGTARSALVLRGRFLHESAERALPPGSGLASELWIRAREVPFDPRLRQALDAFDPSLEELWQLYSPGGAAHCELSYWKELGDPAGHYDLRVDLAGATARPDAFQVTVQDLHGAVHVHGTGREVRADLSLLRGRIVHADGAPDAGVLIHGTVEQRDGRVALDVTSVASEVNLDAALATALDQNGSFPRRAWDALRPEGKVDVVVRQLRGFDDDTLRTHLRIQLKNTVSRAEMLPFPALEITGVVEVRDQVAAFRDLRGRVGGAVVTCVRGVARPTGDGLAVDLLLKVEGDFPVDANLARMMSGRLREQYLLREARGQARLQELDLQLFFPRDGSEFTARFSAAAEAKNLRLLLGTEIRDVNGILRIEDAYVGPDGAWAEGSISNGSFLFLDHKVQDAAATFRADPQEIQLEDVAFRLHDGRVENEPEAHPALVYRYGTENLLSCWLRWDGVSLSKLLQASGVQLPHRGTLSGHVHLHSLVNLDFVDMVADARVVLRDARLGEVPLFTDIYRQMDRPVRPNFDSLELVASARDRQIRIQEFHLGSPLLEVSGDGSLTMDGYLDLAVEFPNVFGPSAEWLVLPEILRRITDRLIRFRVFGYLRAMKAQPEFLFQSRPRKRILQPIAPTLPPRPLPRY